MINYYEIDEQDSETENTKKLKMMIIKTVLVIQEYLTEKKQKTA